MTLPLSPPVTPMLAKLARELPVGGQWRYEPKFDGFRALAFRDGDEVDIRSRNHRPFARYFPEVVEALLRCRHRGSCWTANCSWSARAPSTSRP